MRAVAVLMVLLVVGCQHDPNTTAYTTAQPKTNDLAGTHVPTTKTLSQIAKEGHYPTASPSIVLTSDGTIVITDIPDWWVSFGESRGAFDSGRGSWGVVKHQEWWALGVVFRNTEHLASVQSRFAKLGSSPGDYGAVMMLVGEKAPYKIHLILGDPDEGRSMQFERSP